MQALDHKSQIPNPKSPLLADCHLHFEGSLPPATLERLAGRAGNPFSDFAVFDAARRRISDPAGFLSLYAQVCGLFRDPEDYFEAARAIGEALARDGVAYAEVYVSPEIFTHFGLPAGECLAAIAEAFGDSPGGCDCRILLDVVRQWGPESAARVLDLHEEDPHPGVVGFGMGGDENSRPAAEFAEAFARARSLNLKTSVHAGEWAGADSMEEVLDSLAPDRVDHGAAAAASPRLLQRLIHGGTTLCMSPSSNLVTGAVSSFERHPLRRLLEAGVRVALSADDPLLFATTTSSEYRIARERLGLAESALRGMAENAWRAAFCDQNRREAGVEALASWTPP